MLEHHVGLLSVALAGIINLWLSYRCGMARRAVSVPHGDGGDIVLQRRMRAQANFTEYTPIALLMILALDYSEQSPWLLGLTALIFLVGRASHAFGMDADTPGPARMFGMLATLLPYAIWIVWLLLVVFRAV
ncbi:MAPEG family protein [Aurantiacibacter poecillastricola]|uniref:MAPEG family protein n=1 Tax=Aurantiacibacter poecillastricola TaxID=3064385 RepID=UPI00273F1CCC|nr:MAPEG family protein [Aurantiacibacter sp. 219JJ12-13]MDP5262620.1 MAPEG family protein [Aurantiacibacter sp. 219JJ12-13]